MLQCVQYQCSHPVAEEKGGVAEDERVKSKREKKENEEEGGVFWKTLKAGLTANTWVARYKTGLCSALQNAHSSSH